MDRDVLDDLVQKRAEFVSPEGRWRVYYLGFARGGWSSEAKGFAKTFGKAKIHGKNWQAVGISLLDLPQVDMDLKAWSKGKDDEVEIQI